MALILQNARFLHVPKTGGTYTTHALQAACDVVEDFRIQGSDHTTLDESPHPELFTFAFVRHPLTWWQSMWLFHRGPARKYVVSHKVCSVCWSEDFGTFMENVLEHFPGEYGDVIEHYIGPVGGGIDYVGRQENLTRDLLTALQIAGEPFDLEALATVAPANVSDRSRPAEYTPELAHRVLEAERATIERFGYVGSPADPAAAAAWESRLRAPGAPMTWQEMSPRQAPVG